MYFTSLLGTYHRIYAGGHIKGFYHFTEIGIVEVAHTYRGSDSKRVKERMRQCHSSGKLSAHHHLPDVCFSSRRKIEAKRISEALAVAAGTRTKRDSREHRLDACQLMRFFWPVSLCLCFAFFPFLSPHRLDEEEPENGKT
jgi:hypothetical protein